MASLLSRLARPAAAKHRKPNGAQPNNSLPVDQVPKRFCAGANAETEIMTVTIIRLKLATK